ncbi:hypothetical protein BCR34DRAFT_582879 [Clohesyomyces aquaticus]|uniref:Uncharacterized protein n=1 Tax=Clohesyomyces aquaticus TaxID=1231657 RepID=A0A1Y2A7V5_9PLEO|nr:hypothetical protein BCR34DRAFT_582879 [Clohesyomyces aquaticus]
MRFHHHFFLLLPLVAADLGRPIVSSVNQRGFDCENDPIACQQDRTTTNNSKIDGLAYWDLETCENKACIEYEDCPACKLCLYASGKSSEMSTHQDMALCGYCFHRAPDMSYVMGGWRMMFTVDEKGIEDNIRDKREGATPRGLARDGSFSAMRFAKPVRISIASVTVLATATGARRVPWGCNGIRRA